MKQDQIRLETSTLLTQVPEISRWVLFDPASLADRLSAYLLWPSKNKRPK